VVLNLFIYYSKDFNGCAIQIFEWSKIDKLIVVEYQEQYFSNIFDKRDRDREKQREKDRERRKKGLPTLKEQHISGMLFAKDKKKTSLF
jgi:hypothetical protein